MTINCSPFNGFAKVSVCGGACLRGGGPVDRSSETRSRARGGGNVCTGRRCRRRPQGRRRSRRQATRSARSRQQPGCAGPQRRAQVHPAGRGHCRGARGRHQACSDALERARHTRQLHHGRTRPAATVREQMDRYGCCVDDVVRLRWLPPDSTSSGSCAAGGSGRVATAAVTSSCVGVP
jgi:hypothetical protein